MSLKKKSGEAHKLLMRAKTITSRLDNFWRSCEILNPKEGSKRLLAIRDKVNELELLLQEEAWNWEDNT